MYLGPSEQSPGCIVYVPSTRQFFTSRDVICYEDVQPGIRGVESRWRALADDIDAAHQSPLLVSKGAMDDVAVKEVSVDTTVDATVISQSAPIEHLPETALGDEVSEVTLGPINQRPSGEGNGDHADTDSVARTSIPDSQVPSVPSQHRLPATDTADPDDPNSRLFRRQLPPRATRYTGAYYCDPSTASVVQTIRNAVCMAMFTHVLVPLP